MKKTIRITESELCNLVRKIISESEEKSYYIVAYPDHLKGLGMFIFTESGYSNVPISISYRRRMTFEELPKIYHSKNEAMKDLKMLRKLTKNRRDLKWFIKEL